MPTRRHHRDLVPSASRPRHWRVGLATSLLASCWPVLVQAETSYDDLARKFAVAEAAHAREIADLKAQIHMMKDAIGETRAEARHAVRSHAVADRGPVPLPPPANPAVPAGAVPAFVTADKKLQFGAITITPSGFIAAEGVFRSRTTQSDINTGFGNIPLDNSPLAHTNETRPTARQSRAALLVEGRISPSLIASAYGEFDFLGASTASNATDTNGYTPRVRNLYAAFDMTDAGVHVLAGQNWSLLTLNSKGITPRNEVPPPVIDGQFLPGFTFARQAQVRVVKDFDKRLWLALSAEESQTTFGAAAACTGATLAGAGGAAVTAAATPTVNAICAATGSGAGFSQYGQPYSLNHVPDLIGKVAYEARLGDRDIHLEAEGLYKNIYDRSEVALAGVSIPGTGGTNHNTTGYGIGGGLTVPVLPKRLDFQGSILAGRGIGRYGAGLLPDATINADGSLKAIGEVQAMAGFTLHATPALDIYAFAGIEREQRAVSQIGATAAGPTYLGYGSPNALNSGCSIENAVAATCSNQTQALFQVTGGLWDKVYKGDWGEVRLGLQYSYTQRDIFTTQYNGPLVAGSNQTLAAEHASFSPKANESMIFTSLRYYPFQ